MIEDGAVSNATMAHPDRIPLVPSGGTAAVRLGVQVREALPGDMESLVALCLAARREAAVGAQLCSDDADRLPRPAGSAPSRPGGRVLVALLDDEPAGLLLARVVGPSPFTDLVSLDIEAVYVLPAARRRGLGHALLVGADDRRGRGRRDRGVLLAPARVPAGMQRFLAASRLRARGIPPGGDDGRAAAQARPRAGHAGAGGTVRGRGLEVSRTSSRAAGRRGPRGSRSSASPPRPPVRPRRGSGPRGVDQHAGQPRRGERPRPSSSSTTTS